MPKRPRSHELEDLSRNQLRNIFTQNGWVVWDLHPDYGEDLFVRIFSNQTSTQYSFFVQAKATDHIEDYIKEDGKLLSYPIKVDHIELWEHFWEPVLLTIWDAKSNITYWEVVQDFMQERAIHNSKRKTMKIEVPIDNILTQESLKIISKRTQLRYERFKILSEGTEALINLLKNKYEVEVEYSAEKEIWLIKRNSEMSAFLLGEIGDFIEALALEKHMDVEVLFNKIVIDAIAADIFNSGDAYEEHIEDGSIIIRYKRDKHIISTFDTIKEWETIKKQRLNSK